MNWVEGKISPPDEGTFLVRTSEGLCGTMIGYSVRYYARGRWYVDIDMTVTHWCVIEEPVPFEGLRIDPLDRIECVAADRRGVDRHNINPGRS